MITLLLHTVMGAAAVSAAAANDPALQPPAILHDPGPEYADSARIFQGIPGIERAQNGRLWATWYSGGPTEGPWNYVLLATSNDDGQSWSPPQLIIDPPGNVRAFDPCLWHDPDGRLWLFWAQSYGLWDGRAGVWAITCDNSGEARPRWSAPRRLCDGIMMNKPTLLSTGEWLLPAAIWAARASAQSAPHQHHLPEISGSHAVVSTDRGESWRLRGLVDVPGRSCDEQMLVERRDGTLWMLVRTRDGIGESFSGDGGRTWSAGRHSESVSHIPTARFFIRRLASGRLLLVKHAPPDGKTRSHLVAYLSDDDGQTWQGGLMLDERRGVSYPDGVQAPDGTLYLIYDRNRKTDKQILMATFTEADVLAGENVSGRLRRRVLVNQATGQRPIEEYTLADNADGEPPATGAWATVEVLEGETGTFEKGTRLFTNRAYTAYDAPAPLAGRTLARSSIDRIRAVCRQPGTVMVITPARGRNRDSLQAELLRQGFRKVRLPEFILFDPETAANACTTFQKRVEEGERIELGKWGVLLY